jgi:hypothetical protein
MKPWLDITGRKGLGIKGLYDPKENDLNGSGAERFNIPKGALYHGKYPQIFKEPMYHC